MKKKGTEEKQPGLSKTKTLVNSTGLNDSTMTSSFDASFTMPKVDVSKDFVVVKAPKP